jgi:hypothetical protein
MEANQIKLLSSLAKKLKKEKRERSQIISTLQAAKILTKNENFTTYYSNLKKVVTASK